MYKSPPSDNVTSVGDCDADQTSSKIISTLLHEYDALKRISETISPPLLPLVRCHFTAIEIEGYCNA